MTEGRNQWKVEKPSMEKLRSVGDPLLPLVGALGSCLYQPWDGLEYGVRIFWWGLELGDHRLYSKFSPVVLSSESYYSTQLAGQEKFHLFRSLYMASLKNTDLEMRPKGPKALRPRRPDSLLPGCKLQLAQELDKSRSFQKARAFTLAQPLEFIEKKRLIVLK